MKQKLKALASLCLALALTLCLTLPAWAAGGERLAENSRGNVTIEGLPETSTENLKVTAYKIIEVKYYSDGEYDAPYDPAFSWVSVNDTAVSASKSVADWVRGTTGNDLYKNYIGLAGEDGEKDDNSVQKAFSEAEGNNVAAFYDDLANAIRENVVTFSNGYTVESGTTGVPEGNPSITLTQVPPTEPNPATVTCELKNFKMGSYLVLIEGGMKIYKPVVVNLTPEWKNGAWTLSQDVPALTAKYSEPSITKTVRDTADGATEERKYAQVDIGDTVTYTLVADVPEFPADAINDGYQISDNLPAGMTLNADSVKVFGGNENSQETVIAVDKYELKSTDATRPEGVTEDADTKNVDFSITFDNIVDIYKNYSKIKITYTATANKDIKVVGDSEGEDTNTTGNQNIAYLDYNNNPYEKADDTTPLSWQTAKATAIVYTYGIKVTKTDDKKPGELLAGAEFQVYKDANENGEIDNNEHMLNFVAVVGNDGTYRVAATGGGTTTNTVATGTSTTDPNLTLSGLDVGTYILKETKAPDGYNLPSHTFSVTITDKQDVASGAQTPNGKPEYIPREDGATETDRDDGYERTIITNTKGFTLPTTGGMGTVLFTAGGVVLMGAGLVLLVVFLRRRRAK